MKILIAEDDAVSRSILSAILKKGGHEVEATCDGAEAWEALQRPDAPRLAILDWMMPEIDGIEVIGRIRALATEQPPYVILLTARADKRDIVKGLDAGADDYLVKPFDSEELRARVEVGCRIVTLQDRLTEKIRELHDALDHIKTLRGIVPICARCKKIRDDQGYWRQVEAYIRDHTDARFTHGICPECIKILYPQLKNKPE